MTEYTGILLRFLRPLLEVPVGVYGGETEGLKRFEKQNCLTSRAQPNLRAETLALLCRSAKEGFFYEISDSLGIRLLFFVFEGETVLCGPYVEQEWEQKRAEERLLSAGLSSSWLVPYQLYYCNYRILSGEELRRQVQAAISALHPGEASYVHRYLEGLGPDSAEQFPLEDFEEYELAQIRYARENELMQMIREGRPKAALESYKRLSNMKEGIMIPQTVDAKSRLASATALRTLCRKAAESAGMHPAQVDAISQNYGQKCYAAKSEDALPEIIKEMIADYAEAVRQSRQGEWSDTVRIVIDYIRLHLGNQMTLEELAQEAGTSTNYLCRIFKKETGSSVFSYIAQLRCAKAAQLLISTNLYVQDISAHVGYLDNNYFVKVFRAQYGMTPVQYRKEKGRWR